MILNMRNKLPLSVLFIISITFGLTKCLLNTHKQDNYTFQWDMSYENHTGVPKDLYLNDGKHRGMSVFNWRDYNDDYANQLIKNNIEWVALIPFIYQKTEKTKRVRSRNTDIGVWSDIDSMYMNIVLEFHEKKMHIMFKPHLWMSEGWRSNIAMDSAQEWEA